MKSNIEVVVEKKPRKPRAKKDLTGEPTKVVHVELPAPLTPSVLTPSVAERKPRKPRAKKEPLTEVVKEVVLRDALPETPLELEQKKKRQPNEWILHTQKNWREWGKESGMTPVEFMKSSRNREGYVKKRDRK